LLPTMHTLNCNSQALPHSDMHHIFGMMLAQDLSISTVCAATMEGWICMVRSAAHYGMVSRC
jgi:hypothetical protein